MVRSVVPPLMLAHLVTPPFRLLVQLEHQRHHLPLDEDAILGDVLLLAETQQRRHYYL